MRLGKKVPKNSERIPNFITNPATRVGHLYMIHYWRGADTCTRPNHMNVHMYN